MATAVLDRDALVAAADRRSANHTRRSTAPVMPAELDAGTGRRIATELWIDLVDLGNAQGDMQATYVEFYERFTGGRVQDQWTLKYYGPDDFEQATGAILEYFVRNLHRRMIYALRAWTSNVADPLPDEFCRDCEHAPCVSGHDGFCTRPPRAAAAMTVAREIDELTNSLGRRARNAIRQAADALLPVAMADETDLAHYNKAAFDALLRMKRDLTITRSAK